MTIDTKEFRDLLDALLNAEVEMSRTHPSKRSTSVVADAIIALIAHINAQLSAARAAGLEEAIAACERVRETSGVLIDADSDLCIDAIRALAAQAAPTQATPSVSEQDERALPPFSIASFSDTKQHGVLVLFDRRLTDDELERVRAALNQSAQAAQADEKAKQLAEALAIEYSPLTIKWDALIWAVKALVTRTTQAAQGGGVQADDYCVSCNGSGWANAGCIDLCSNCNGSGRPIAINPAAWAVAREPKAESYIEALGQLQNRAAELKLVVVPMHMTKAMLAVTNEEEWQWEDLLAAAEAITEWQYDEISAAALAANPAPSAAPAWTVLDNLRRTLTNIRGATKLADVRSLANLGLGFLDAAPAQVAQGKPSMIVTNTESSVLGCDWDSVPPGTYYVYAAPSAQQAEAPSQAARDVREFGAVGDGVTDDTAALQKAADWCAQASAQGEGDGNG